VETDESIHVYGCTSGGEVGIILALPADSAIRNPEGRAVPGIVLSIGEARDLVRHILSQLDQMEKLAATRG
jgi:hypothetical protein